MQEVAPYSIPPFHNEKAIHVTKSGIDAFPLSERTRWLYSRFVFPMQMLAEIAAVCCLVLILSIAALWRSMRKTPPATSPQHEPAMRKRRLHPRMDLAAGVVASSQSVRARSRGQGLQKDASVPNASDSPLRKRSDRAYFNEDMGDLRDPNMGIAPAGGVRRPTGTLSKPEYR